MSTLDKDIVENAAKAGFKRLGDALKAAGLIGTYKGTGPFTFFAPTDEAFEKIPPGACARCSRTRRSSPTSSTRT